MQAADVIPLLGTEHSMGDNEDRMVPREDRDLTRELLARLDERSVRMERGMEKDFGDLTQSIKELSSKLDDNLTLSVENSRANSVLEGRVERVEKRVEEFEAAQTWIIRLAGGTIVTAILAWVLSGGLAA